MDSKAAAVTENTDSVHVMTTADKTKRHVDARTRTTVNVPVVGEFLPGPGSYVVLPDRASLVYVGAVAGLAVLEVVEWPVGVALIAGHWLAQQRTKSRALAAVEEALQDVG